jgi:hypothetical protein
MVTDDTKHIGQHDLTMNVIFMGHTNQPPTGQSCFKLLYSKSTNLYYSCVITYRATVRTLPMNITETLTTSWQGLEPLEHK